jgi:superfamily I DNA/RNA helicase
MTKNWLDNLTPEQQKVVLHGCSGDTISPAEALLVLAGAGAGKTTTLAAFAAHRISLGIDPSRILVLAFNWSAAREIERRIGGMVGNAIGGRRTDFSRCATFHAIGLQFIRRYASRQLDVPCVRQMLCEATTDLNVASAIADPMQQQARSFHRSEDWANIELALHSHERLES